MITVFENMPLSPSLKEGVKDGHLVAYQFSNPDITGSISCIKNRLTNLNWPKHEDNAFKEELSSIITGLKELDEFCHQFNEAKLAAAGVAIGDINIKKGSIKKSLLILNNILPLSDRGTYTLPVSERFDARILDYKKHFEEVGDSLVSVKQHYEMAKCWAEIYDSTVSPSTMGIDDGDGALLVLQVIESAVLVISRISNWSNKRKAKKKLNEIRETLPCILAELESHLCKIDMFVAALNNTKEIYEWFDNTVGAFFDKTVHETSFKSAPVSKSIDESKFRVLWVSSKALKELAEAQVIPVGVVNQESYLEGVCTCSNSLTSMMIEKPKDCYYSES